MANPLKLTKAIGDKAKQMFKDVNEGKHLKGYSTHLIATGCLHIACRWVKSR
jgi:transcription initiation factor TFIIIB Brf1 subunit/transcription initiation factor TFIIB